MWQWIDLMGTYGEAERRNAKKSGCVRMCVNLCQVWLHENLCKRVPRKFCTTCWTYLPLIASYCWVESTIAAFFFTRNNSLNFVLYISYLTDMLLDVGGINPLSSSGWGSSGWGIPSMDMTTQTVQVYEPSTYLFIIHVLWKKIPVGGLCKCYVLVPLLCMY